MKTLEDNWKIALLVILYYMLGFIICLNCFVRSQEDNYIFIHSSVGTVYTLKTTHPVGVVDVEHKDGEDILKFEWK